MSEPILTVPLIHIPVACFPDSTNDQLILKTLRKTCAPEDGYFMIRKKEIDNPSGSFILVKDTRFIGNWFLGRVRQKSNSKRKFEIIVRKTGICYYQEVSSPENLAQELRFLLIDGDGELETVGSNNSPWTFNTDSEFKDIGFY